MTVRPTLTRALLRSPGFGAGSGLIVPSEGQLALPERAVQFGTGAFLRGFIDFFVDEANRRGEFNGRIVAVGSTESGREGRINEQDGLYTLSSRGVAGGGMKVEHRIVGSVSRALSARHEWGAVLECARNPELRVVFSNTTEVGIALDNADRDPDAAPPPSFPGKLTRFLLERARAVRFEVEQGVVVVPCELIEDNGDKLREMVLTLAARWKVESEFAEWLDMAVPFCNTLVDRIVPGAPAPDEAATLAEALGYDDAMLTTAEVYRLFAIELPTTGGDFGGEVDIGVRLGFTHSDRGIVLAHDITPYRLRKVRMLNGTHTIAAPVGLLAGCTTVREAVEDDTVGRFIRRALLDEIVPTIAVPDGEEFAREVLDRFANPYIHHALVGITLQGTMKMRVRVVPSIVEHAARFGRAPASLAFGFAAFLRYMRGDAADARRAAGERVPPDDHAAEVRGFWRDGDRSRTSLAAVAARACAATSLWGADLAAVPGFVDAVTDALTRIERDGIVGALDAHLAEVTA